MKYQSNRNYKSNDCIMTPINICKDIITHFKPYGKILEPCKGTGNFLKVMDADWCEITEGIDFLTHNKHYDWIITNPPWSKIRIFLNHSMELADNIIFLITINHLWTKARIGDILGMKFGIKEIYLIDAPKELNNSGFQVGCIYLKRDYTGKIKLTNFY